MKAILWNMDHIQKSLVYNPKTRKEKLCVFSSNRKLAFAVSTLGERLPFQLIGLNSKTMSTFLVSLVIEGST